MQTHLSFKDTVNLGSYYTPNKIISQLYNMLKRNVPKIEQFKIIDSSCGYGYFFKEQFFKPEKCIGIDIDREAIQGAKKQNKNITFYHSNSLQNAERKKWKLAKNEKIIFIGNPPYNDKTSIIRNKLKKEKVNRDKNLIARDLGISFLLSYDQLKADYVCVLHPLSYLIKKTNFNALKQFKDNYHLIDALVFSSAEFNQKSKLAPFPIIIACYRREKKKKMDYDFIKNYNFKTIEGKQFKINDFDYINNYVDKYPNSSKVNKKQAIALFWTLRDINALRRNKTFIKKINSNTIFITKEKMPYYHYIDIFKQNIKNIPYYFGNLDIMIDNKLFLKYKKDFIKNNTQQKHIIESYFKNLLKQHYVY